MINNLHPKKIHLISFYTEGKNLDPGFDLHRTSEIFKNKARLYFDSVQFFSPRILISKDPSWKKILEDKREIMEQYEIKGLIEKGKWNTHWAALNFQLWKPKLIQDLLNSSSIEEDEILLYHDINFSKYPEYLSQIHRWNDYFKKKFSKRSIILFNDNNARITTDTKPDLLETYLPSVKYNHAKMHHIWAGAIAFKKNAKSIEFVDQWVDLCTEENLSPIYYKTPTPDFAWHSLDQACLTVNYFSNNWYLNSNCECVFLWGKRLFPTSLKQKLRYLLGELYRRYVKKILDKFR